MNSSAPSTPRPSPLLALALNLGLALLFFGLTRLGMARDNPAVVTPGFGLAAGLGLGAVLIYGWPMLFGILLGAFAANLGPLGGLANAPLASLLAGSLALQSWLGAWLLRRLVGPLPPPTVKLVLRTLVLSALAALVAPLVAVLSLNFSGLIGAEAAMTLAWQWWLIFYAGMLIVTPGILIFNQVWCRQPPHEALIWPLAGLILGLTLFGFLLIWQNQEQRLQARLRTDTDAAALLLSNEITQQEYLLNAVHSFFFASQSVTPAEFRRFVRPLLDQPVAVEVIVWAPVITPAERSAFEAAQRAAGMADFTIFELGPDGQVLPATGRPLYYPVLLFEPFAPNEAALGFDLGSEHERWQTLQQARDTGVAALSAPITLVHRPDGPSHLLLMRPLYQSEQVPATLAQRRAELQALVYSAVKLDDFLAHALANDAVTGLNFYFFDLSDDQIRPLGVYPPRDDAAPVADPRSLRSANHAAVTLQLAGRSWQMIARPGPAYLAAAGGWAAWIWLLLGLGLTTVFLLCMQARQMAEERLRISERRSKLLLRALPDMLFRMSREGLIHDYAASAEQQFYLPPEQFLNRHVNEVLPPEVAAQTIAAIERVFVYSGLQSLEYEMTFGGEVRTYEARIDRTPDEDELVMIIRDISANRAATAALQRSEARYRLISEHAADVIWVFDMEQQRFTYVSPSVERMFGYTPQEVLDQQMSTTLPPASQARVYALLTAHPPALGHPPVVIELEQQRKDGTLITSEITISYVVGEDGHMQVLGVSRDMSERKEAQQALHDREEIFSNIVGQALDGIALIDAETARFVEFNEAAYRDLGYTREEFAEGGLLGFQADHSPDLMRQNIARVLSEGSASFETHHRRRDGTLCAVHMRARRLHLHNREHIIAAWTDITERKRAEARLHKLNRAYLVLSEVNEAIVRMRDPQVLFETACRIAVSEGGFRMAWIGMLDPQTRCVHPVASAGQVNGYLEQLAICLDDSPHGHGPTATAMRSRTHVVSNDIAHDPRMEPWREHALRLGYRALAVFPLVVADTVRGSLNLYAPEPDFFDEAELKLFDEMAGDISFALEFIAQEQQRRQAMAEITQLSRVVEQMDDVVMITDISGKIRYVNPAFEREFGYSRAEVLDQNPRMIKSNLESPVFYQQLWTTILNGESFQGEIRNRRKDGQLIYEAKTITPIRDEAGVITHFVATGKNITARKQIEHDLEERLKELTCLRQVQHLVEQDPDLNEICFQVVAYLVVAMQYPEVAVARLELEEQSYGTISPAIPPERQLSAEIMVGGVACGRLTVAYADALCFIIPEEQNLVDGIAHSLGLWLDRRHAAESLTRERNSLARRVEERTADLSRANVELARAVRAKDDFLANMSHELRTPLNAILALSEGLLEQLRGPLNERQVASLHNIEASGRHLLTLINDILDLSKVEAGRMDLQREIISLNDICAASMIFVKEQASKKQIRLGFSLNDQQAVVQADPKRLKQILVNLLSNAVKFTPSGGTISLEVETDALAGVVRFAVCDTGIGIAAEDLPRLFRPFMQLDSSLSRRHEGTGLGLALVQRLSEMHGGSIIVESVPGSGSCFTVALPYPAEPAPARSSGPILAGSELLRSALVIEDSETASEQLARYLAELHIHAVIHSRGAGAVDQVATLRPDVIFLDLQMPDQSGWEILAELKATPQLQAIPVIIISVVDERARGLAAGASEYLVKPISREMLRRVLGRLVNATPSPRQEALIIGLRAAPQPTGVRVLLVEDNEFNIAATGDYLQDRGYAVVVARNGREALTMAEEAKPDVILMDIQMPVMDGLEATRQLRARPAFAHTPLIALTALAMPGDRERCLEAGASAYLTKPVSLKRLIETITDLIVEKR